MSHSLLKVKEKMYTIFNDILFDIAAIPNKLGQFILEEGNDLRENITSWKEQFQLSDDFLSEMMMSASITFGICSVFAYWFLNWYADSLDIKSKPQSKLNTPGKVQDQDQGKKEVDKKGVNVGKKFPAIQGTYLYSVHEVNTASKNIISKFQKDHAYWVLLRVRLRNPIDMFGTKLELENTSTCNTKKSFQTRDAFLTMRFKIVSDIVNKDFGNVLVHFMNLLNHTIDTKYYTSDFIVCAICESSITVPNEFINGLNHIGYEMENLINVNAKTANGNTSIAYSLMLPVHGIYDLFMDVYNNCLFESKKYVIDDNNNESWDNNKICKQFLEVKC